MDKWKILKNFGIAVVVLVALLLLSAFIASEPFYESDFEKPIEKKTRWIEVPGESFDFEGYAAEHETVTITFDFAEPYVSELTIFLIWEDDSRTEPDTFLYSVVDRDGKQWVSGSSSAGTAMASVTLNNTEIKHVENNVGWIVEITCHEARDGYLGPGGILTIPDDGNDFTVRFEWNYFKEHNPDW